MNSANHCNVINVRGTPNGAVIPLFFGPLRRGRSRIPALEEHSVADNFLQKQQKQRDDVEERPITDAFFAETRLDLGSA
jgi:hypothetical protein